MQPIAYFGAVLGLALFGRLTLTTATSAFCCSLFLQAWFSRRSAARAADRSDPRQDHTLRRLYSYGLRVWASTIPQQINVRLDLLALSIMPAIASSELGVYAVAASLSWLALPAAAAFGSIAFPAVARATRESAVRHIERVSLLGSAATTAAVLALVCVVAPFVVPRLFGPDFHGAIICLWLLAPGTVFLAMNRTLDSLLQGRGKPLSTAAGEGVAAVVTIALLAALAPHFGIRGAAVASSAAYLSSTIVLWARLRVLQRRGAARSGELEPT